MPTKINPDFKPDERSYTNLRKHGAIPEFVDWELPNFIEYFTETGGKKKAWQMTCQRWMRTAWKGKAGRQWEKEREFESLNRPYKKQPADIFQFTLGDMMAEGLPKPEKKRRIYGNPIHTPIPGANESPLSSEDAFAQLRKSGVIK